MSNTDCPFLKVFLYHIDTRVEHYYLLSSIWMPVSIISVYLLLVLKILPAFMEKRPPMNLRKIIMGYNALQIALNLVIGYIGCKSFFEGLDFLCADIDYTESSRGYRELTVCYMFYVTKLVDLVDTVFFILKKNTRQVTYLHLYHHTAVVLMSWFIVRYTGGGHTLWAGFLNCCTHICMYSYYLLTAYDQSYKQSLKLKKAVTLVQMIQFGFSIFLFATPIVRRTCSYPKVMSLILIPQNAYFLYLFMQFYNEAYNKRNGMVNGTKKTQKLKFG